MNVLLWETFFGKKGSLFGFGRGTVPYVFEGMRGFKTYKETFIVKDEDGNYKEIAKIWNDEETVHD